MGQKRSKQDSGHKSARNTIQCIPLQAAQTLRLLEALQTTQAGMTETKTDQEGLQTALEFKFGRL
jgi:hypothetical protein